MEVNWGEIGVVGGMVTAAVTAATVVFKGIAHVLKPKGMSRTWSEIGTRGEQLGSDISWHTHPSKPGQHNRASRGWF